MPNRTSKSSNPKIRPAYDLDKIKFATDEPTFEKAIILYEQGKVTKFKEEFGGYYAVVLGSHQYNVSVSARRYDDGNCDCYLGQNDTLCKHMVVVAIRAVTGGKPLTDDDKKLTNSPVCSGRLGELSKENLVSTKRAIVAAVRYIKPYNGPSRIWFSYQNSLREGCARLSAFVSELPVGEQTAKLLVDTLLRLDEKLCRGRIDDSDGTVGGFMEEVVNVLKEYTKLDSNCSKTFEILKGRKTCFGWEEPLLEIFDEKP